MKSSHPRPIFFAAIGLIISGCVLAFALPDLVEIRRGEQWPLGIEPEFQLSEEHLLDERVVTLGKRLFFDKNLSRDRSVSCGTCHDPSQGFSNGKPFGEGIDGQQGARNVPTIINRLMGKSQFWDGRADSLEAQALGPLFAADEMGMDEALVKERLAEDPTYHSLFKAAFDNEPNIPDLARAIATFERTIVCGDSPFDKFEWNGEQDALSESAKRGLLLFRGKARCSTCHTGTNFTDEKFHNLGIGAEKGTVEAGHMQVTGKASDLGAYKTPTLRAISLTAPYMHDGSLTSLREVIDFYDRGGVANDNLDPEIKPLELTEAQKTDLEAFLNSLTGPIVSLHVAEIKDYLP